MDEVTLPHRASQQVRAILVLDYASSPLTRWRYWGRKAAELGPWVIWPSLRSWACLALLLAGALWLSRMPRNWQVIDEFRAVYPIMFGANDRLLYRMPSGTLRIRSVGEAAGGDIELQPSSMMGGPRISADGSRVIAFGQGEVLMWDSASGQVLGRFPEGSLTHNGQASVYGLVDGALSSDGTRFAVRYPTGDLAVWDITAPSSPKLVAVRRLDGELSSSSAGSFSADGRHLLLWQVGFIWLGNAQTLEDELRIPGKASSFLCASWSADRTSLIVGIPTGRQAEWDVQVLDPANPRSPIAQVTRHGDVQNPSTSRDGHLLVLGGQDVYEIPSGRKIRSYDWPDWVRDVVGNNLLDVSNRAWEFTELVDPASGSIVAILPVAASMHALDGQRTLISDEGSGRIRVRRQVRQGPEQSAIASPRLWVMLPLTLGLAWSLCRDARRRARKPASTWDRLAGIALILVGTLAPAFGLAQTAVEWNVGLREWWGGHWTDNLSLVCLFCGMGLLAGGRAWLWINRAFLALAVVVALINGLTTRNEPQFLIAMDRMWIASPYIVRAWCAAVVALAGIVLLGIGRAHAATRTPFVL